MDALEVKNAMNAHWQNYMSKYYDHISENYIKFIAKEYNLDIEEINKKCEHLKSKILSKAVEICNDEPIIRKTLAKTKSASKEVDPSLYGKMSRADLIDLCKKNNIRPRRSNKDMIDALKETLGNPETSNSLPSTSDANKVISKETIDDDDDD